MCVTAQTLASQEGCFWALNKKRKKKCKIHKHANELIMVLSKASLHSSRCIRGKTLLISHLLVNHALHTGISRHRYSDSKQQVELSFILAFTMFRETIRLQLKYQQVNFKTFFRQQSYFTWANTVSNLSHGKPLTV